MPIAHEILDKDHLVIATISGVLTGDDIRGYQQAIWERVDVRGYDEVVDATAVERIDYKSSREVREIAEMAGRMDSHERTARLAIVAPTPESFGMARMYQQYRESVPGNKEVRVFKTMDEARAWLATAPTT